MTQHSNNTNCDICGGSLMHPDEIKEGVHGTCFTEWKGKNYPMR